MQGWQIDDSDTEWETSIKAGFGTTASGFLEQFNATVDQDMDMATLVNHHFHTYDGIAGAIGAIPDPDSSDSEGDDGNLREAELGQTPIHDGPGMERLQPMGQAARAANIPHMPGMEGPEQSIDSDDEDRDDDVPAMEEALNIEREAMEENARTPLYVGAKLTQLSCTLLLLNFFQTHGASNLLVNELF